MTLAPAWLSLPETQALIAAFTEAQAELRFVGGCVRDSLLGRNVSDIDAATPLTPDEVTALLERAQLIAIPTGIQHGTVTALVGERTFEITTLREDVATDGRRAEVAFTDDWQQDAARRDFTMNALYLSPEGELFDYFGGEIDAREGRVRFIGDAQKRIEEDYLRILRFFRFYAHYGKTSPDVKALAACAKAAPNIEKLSAERIRHEMLKLLSAPRSYHAISFMFEQHILPHALGFGITSRSPLRRLEEMTAVFAQPMPATGKLAALLLSAEGNASPEKLAVRWRLSNHDTGHMQALMALVAQLSSSLPEAAQKRLIRKHGAMLFCEAVLLAWAQTDDMIDKAHPYSAMLALARQWQPPVFMITGGDLKALGIPEGRRLGELLVALEEQWEASGYSLDKTALLAGIEKSAI